MFKHTIIFAAVAGLVLALAPAAQAIVIVTDPGVPAYRLVFVTSQRQTSSPATDLAYCNGFVTDAVTAAGGDLAALGATWKCIGSTSSISAKSNTGTDTTGGANDVPIYNLAGELVATSNAALWDGSIDTAIDVDENGNLDPSSWVDTGTTTAGTPSAYPFGHATDITYANANANNGTWINAGYEPHHSERLYGMSDVIPEPATMALLAFGGLGVLLRRRRRS